MNIRVLCHGCEKAIHIDTFGGVTGDGKGKTMFWHTLCLLLKKKHE